MRSKKSASNAEVLCSMACTIDSSLWTAALLKEEQHHHTAFSFLSSVIEQGEEIIIPVTIYIEIVMAFTRRGAVAEAEMAGEFLFKIPALKFVEITYPRMIDIVKSVSSLKLRGMDAIVVAIAREYSTRLATLDRELAAKAKRAVEVINLF